MSKEGYEKLKAQLDRMKHEDMPRIAEQIAQARGYGDLSENAEFDAAVEAQGMLQAKINDLQDKLSRAFIVDKTTMPTDRVVFGSKVRVLDLDLERGRGLHPRRPRRRGLRPEQDPAHQPDRSGARRQEGRRRGRGPHPPRQAQAQDRRDRHRPRRSASSCIGRSGVRESDFSIDRIRESAS